MENVLVSMKEIDKQFPGVRALNQCHFELRAGEVHALVGENGAGKSTLMKILTGVYQKDAGTILYKGSSTDIPDTRTARELGISIIHQELQLMPDLTVAQNIFIGREPRKYRGLLLNERMLNERASALFAQLNVKLEPAAKVAGLTVAMQQMVEISKALSYHSEVLIMDEPTAALTDREIEDLFHTIRRLRARGVGIVYISHRMDELKEITDRITVMRDGCYVDTVTTSEVEIDDIIAMMVGRQIYVTSQPDNIAQVSSEKVLEVKNLSRGKAVRNISFHLKKGEILGFAGLMGAGRTEVARAIFGAETPEGGEIYVHGKRVRLKSPADAVKQGIGYLSEDRKRYGLLVDMDVKSNIAIAALRKYRRGFGWMKREAIRKDAEARSAELKIKTPGVSQIVKFLSGGNQQKVVIAKWLTRDCDILMIDEPTRGIDVGAKAEIYKLLDDLAQQGKSIIMISSELPEVLRMSHRVLVMCEGRITGELTREEATQEAIMKFATMRGGSQN
ncbi:sugar ABC transporter ATP-binding protein [Paenibacillus sp. YSY-4.3]